MGQFVIKTLSRGDNNTHLVTFIEKAFLTVVDNFYFFTSTPIALLTQTNFYLPDSQLKIQETI